MSPGHDVQVRTSVSRDELLPRGHERGLRPALTPPGSAQTRLQPRAFDDRLLTNEDGLAVTYYSDDFTGATDVLEVLALAGIRTALFLRAPSREELRAHFSGLQACGVAGVARTLSPTQAEKDVVPILAAIRRLEAPLFHYKICSTFDSSQQIGNIGQAVRTVTRLFEAPVVPMIVGAPALGRYCVFGDLFARDGKEVFRLDRHPVMSRHPVTPMSEAHIPALLAQQASLQTEVIDVRHLASGERTAEDALKRAIDKSPDVLLFDVLDDSSLREVGRLLLKLLGQAWAKSQSLPIFGSSGVEYALAAMGVGGEFPVRPPAYAWSVESAGQTLVLSGSRSGPTRRQIEYSLEHGFTGLPLDPIALSDPLSAPAEADRVRLAALRLIDRGAQVILYVDDEPDGRVTGDSLEIARQMGELTRRISTQVSLQRVIVAGGDTSGAVARALNLYALEMVSPVAPGAPLCRARSTDAGLDGLEVALKAGQVGADDYFVTVAGLSQRHDPPPLLAAEI